MSDFDFDARLERLFSQPPRVSDPAVFARRVEDRLDREWSMRRLLIGAAGVVGAALTLSQTLGAQFLSGAEAVAGPAVRLMNEETARFRVSSLLGDQMLWSGEAVWTVVGLVGLAAAFVATRWADVL